MKLIIATPPPPPKSTMSLTVGTTTKYMKYTKRININIKVGIHYNRKCQRYRGEVQGGKNQEDEEGCVGMCEGCGG